MDRLLNNTEAAQFLGVSPYTLRRYVALRLIPFTRIGKRLVRFQMSALESYLARQTVATRREVP
ncbi:MAG: helix-turn-helix domain-containing protein [Desulfobaccales bacterium]|jgi:excisionase family DNA binding protein